MKHTTDATNPCFEQPMKAYLNAAEVAKLLKVDRATVTRWAKQGKLKGAIRLGDHHQWRIPISAYEELVKQKK